MPDIDGIVASIEGGISQDVAEFLLGVVYGINLNAGQENFDDVVRLVQKARTELRALIPAA